MASNDLQAERRAIRARIEAAFHGVTRNGGVSWSEAIVIDDYGSPEEERAARASDCDRPWMDLVNDPQWQPEDYAVYSYLDPIGFRYYLPAAMVKCLEVEAERDGPWLALAVTLETFDDRKGEPKQQWSLLNESQRRCVAAFLRFMVAWDTLHRGLDMVGWQEALDSYWGTFPAEE
jgi:hypothetical protein